MKTITNHTVSKLSSAVQCSEIMLENAKAGNWGKVIDIEVQRDQLLTELFSKPVYESSTEEIDKKIREIIAINSKLEAIAASARDNTQNDIASLNKGRKSVNVYAQNSL